MDNQQSDDNNWITIPKKTKNIHNKQHKKSHKNKIIWQVGRPVLIQQNAQYQLQQFLQSSSFNNNQKIIKQHLSHMISKKQTTSNKINGIHIQCLGIGDFCLYRKPCYQMYFLRHLLMPICQEYSEEKVTINVYDPVFTNDCKKEVDKIGTHKQYQPMTDSPRQECVRIFFMPHCQHFLYKIVCQAEKQCIVIGNSLKSYVERSEILKNSDSDIFKKKSGHQQKMYDFRESLNDTFIYEIRDGQQ